MVIYVQNASKRVSDDDVNVMTEAVHQQLATQVAPSWAIVAPSLTFLGKGTPPPAKSHVFILSDDPGQEDAGVEGYHDLSPDGYIRGYVFASPSLDNGAQILEGANSVASVLSHEALEALRDPWANYWVDTYGKLVLHGHRYAQVAMEACDPVETDENPIEVLGKKVSLSNFILPNWENPNAQGPVDFLGTVTQPFMRSEGGYVIVRNAVGSEQALFGSRYPEWKKELKLNRNKRSRTHRRLCAGVLALGK